MNKKQLYYKIRAFQKGKPNPIKFNCRAANIDAAMQMFAIVALFSGVPFERFTFQAS